MNVCPICVKEFNVRKNKRVVCWKCDVGVCAQCIETYIINSKREPMCMECKSPWGYKFLMETMSKGFMIKLRTRDTRLLIEREKGLLIETHKYIEYNQYIIGIEKKMKNIQTRLLFIQNSMLYINNKLSLNRCPNCMKEELYYVSKYCYKCFTRLCLFCRKMIDNDKSHVCDQRNKVLLEEYKRYMAERHDLSHEVTAMEKCVKRWRKDFNIDEEAVLKKFADIVIICMCPTGGGCKGFVINYVCNMCNANICKECYCVEEDNHMCDKSNVESVKTLQKVTKPCPRCAVLIEKIDGCNQMWCTYCHSGFDWLSGKMNNSGVVVDNPHYYEWRRHMGSNDTTIDDEQRVFDTQEIPNPVGFINHVTIILKRSYEHNYNVIVSLFRILLHLNDMLQNIENYTVDPIKVNLDLRLSWVFGMIDEQKWGESLFKRMKNKKINDEKNIIFRTFVTASRNISYQIFQNHNYMGINEYVNEWIQLVDYINTCFHILSKVFKLRMPSITMNNDASFFYVLNMKSK